MVTAPEQAETTPLPNETDSARLTAPAVAQQVAGQAEVAYRAWVAHVRNCRAECRSRGVDCSTAKALREALRQAWASQKERR